MVPLAAPSPSRREVFAALKAGLSGTGSAVRIPVERLVPTGVSALDTALGGGFPRGTLVTLEGSAGRWSIAARLVATVTLDAVAAIIDDGGLYPPALAQSGARLDRVLIVPAGVPLGVARAADILLRSRACRLVLMPAVDLRAAVWARLAGLAHRTGILLIVIAALDASLPLAAAAGMRLCCSRRELLARGLRGVWSTFDGYVVSAEVRKYKSAVSGGRALVTVR
jgi:hypothetical protein